ncbi:hypothetical protein MWU53_15770 [Aliiroseovarius sp. S1123]|uniref:COG3904 family protein n=1 Tax=Aliiroseovarius sp. S1123 TaxID=2926404 RepID=UPI001FF577F7|nr:hypothetical protein [Aliiroseovarius sp. S1123]MCK0172519.1 hypothetical protein [Aliiroseovarius sp. S1123]
MNGVKFQWLLAGLFLIVSLPYASAQSASVRVFSEYDKRTLLLDGEIGPGTLLAVKKQLDEFPEVKFLALNSPGGSVVEGLSIAKLVEERGITTLVTEGHSCFSSCSFIFLAGSARYVRGGQLGVHQFTGSRDETIAQEMVAEIYDTLLGFGISSHVMSKMFRTPSDQIYVFTEEELVAFEINRHTKPTTQAAVTEQGADPGNSDNPPSATDGNLNSGVTPLSTNSYGMWTSGYYYFNSISNLMCAIHSRQQGIDFRLVRYLTRPDYFLELEHIPLTMDRGRVEIVFGIEGADASGGLLTLRTEYTSWGGRDISTDITSQRDEEILLSALAKGHTLWIRRIDTELIGRFMLIGSSRAIADFRKCITGDEAYVTRMLSEQATDKKP